jgi:ankyrin repeat protein
MKRIFSYSWNFKAALLLWLSFTQLVSGQETAPTVNYKTSYAKTNNAWAALRNAEVLSTGDSNNSAFFAAIRKKDLDAVKLALQNGADINAKTKKSPLREVGHQTALMLVLRYQDNSILKFLLDNHINVNAVDTQGRAAVDYYPLSEENADLLRAKGAIPRQANELNKSLISAVENKDTDSVNDCLEKGADPNQYDLQGDTALVIAIKNSTFQIITNLIAHGASLTMGCDYFDDGNDGATPLFWAASISPDLTKLLIDLGGKVDVKTKDGTTPLMMAKGATTIRMLLASDAGVDVNARNNVGQTPLSVAIDQDDIDTIKLLVQADANINVISPATTGNPNGYKNLFYYSSVEGSANAVKFLLSKVSEQQTKDMAFLLACNKGNLAVVKVMLENGIDVNTKDATGNSAIIYAAQAGNDDVVKILIQAGAKDRPSGYSENGDPIAIESKDLTKADWKAKVAAKVPAYRASGSTIQVYQKNFVKWFGEPTKTQTVGNRVYWYYDCSDGTIQLDLDGGNMQAGILAGQVNDY